MKHKKIHGKIKVGALNAQSVKNKTISLHEYLLNGEFDILAITETWLDPEKHTSVIAELLPPEYDIKAIPRKNNRAGGGVAIIYKNSINITCTQTYPEATTFEGMDCTIKVGNQSFILSTIYRPPPSKQNKLKTKDFFLQWSSECEKLALCKNRIIIVGDFNFHLDDCKNRETMQFLTLLHSYGLQQHVQESTHRSGHTLDVVITREIDSVIPGPVWVEKPHLYNNNTNKPAGDHYTTYFITDIKNLKSGRKETKFRKYSAIDIEKFKNDICDSLIKVEENASCDELLEAYNSILTNLLNKHAPLQTKMVKIRTRSSWFNNEIYEAKVQKRKLERKWKKSKSQEDHDIFRSYCRSVNALILQTKRNYYCNKIEDKEQDSKELFRLAKSLLGQSNTTILPDHKSPKELAERFNDFFTQKVQNIRDDIAKKDPTPEINETSMHSNVEMLTSFTNVTIEEVEKLIQKSGNKSCELDPIPTWLLKKCLDPLLPLITKIINRSINSAHVPENFKTALLKPLLKKKSLDRQILKNYRPVSNLPFLSKILEKVVANQFKQHVAKNDLEESLQSAYKQYHSTETALLKVQSDILETIDKGKISCLVLLDLSAAFDTIDQGVLLSRLKYTYSIKDSALQWYKSYLTGRKQIAVVEGEKSDPKPLKYGVPQGSVLGPQKFCSYTKPLATIIQQYGINYHMYADDTQLYIPLQFSNNKDSITRLESCIKDVEKWMQNNFLKLNGDKTELIIFGSPSGLRKIKQISINVGDQTINTTQSVRNLGVIFDHLLNMNEHINSVTRIANMYMYNLARIRNYLTTSAAQTLVHAAITSRLDYANSLLYGLPKGRIKNLQKIQNNAARLITKTPRREHITPVLNHLHWLPVNKRINYKIILLTFKAIHGLSPTYLEHMIELYRPKRKLRSLQQLKLQPPLFKTKYGDRSFRASSAVLWNRLPEEIQNISTLPRFRKALKTFLFTNNI